MTLGEAVVPNPLPLTVTVVPPLMLPLVGETEVTVGVAAKASGTAMIPIPATATSEATRAFVAALETQREREPCIGTTPLIRVSSTLYLYQAHSIDAVARGGTGAKCRKRKARYETENHEANEAKKIHGE